MSDREKKAETECWDCVHFRRFPPPAGRPTLCYGCVEPEWAGFVDPPERPPCGGIAFRAVGAAAGSAP